MKKQNVSPIFTLHHKAASATFFSRKYLIYIGNSRNYTYLCGVIER